MLFVLWLIGVVAFSVPIGLAMFEVAVLERYVRRMSMRQQLNRAVEYATFFGVWLLLCACWPLTLLMFGDFLMESK